MNSLEACDYMDGAKYLNFICTKDTFSGALDESLEIFDAYENYELITAFYDSCPECQSFPKEEYFGGNWYNNWEDYVIWMDGRIAARAGIWKVDDEKWEVAGVITRPEYRKKVMQQGWFRIALPKSWNKEKSRFFPLRKPIIL